MWILGSTAVLLILGALGMSDKDSSDDSDDGNDDGTLDPVIGTPAPAPGPAETAACEAVAASRPTEYLGRSRPAGMSDADWYGLVAYWQAYPDGPPDPMPTDPAFGAALTRLRTCVGSRLPKEGTIVFPPVQSSPPAQPPPVNPPPAQAPPLGSPPAQLPPVDEEPTPGGYYRIKPGNNLTNVAQEAYKPTSSGERYGRMILINDAPYNQRFVRTDAADNLFPGGRISFNPRFGTFEQQRADPERGGEDLPGSNEYAVIYIPPVP